MPCGFLSKPNKKERTPKDLEFIKQDFLLVSRIDDESVKNEAWSSKHIRQLPEARIIYVHLVPNYDADLVKLIHP